MMRTYLVVVEILVLSLILVCRPLNAEEEKGKGQTDPAAQEALLQAFKKMDQTKGFHFEGEETTVEEDSGTGAISTKESSIEGIWQNSGVAYTEISKEGKEIEIYQKGDETVSEDSEKGEWQSVSHRTFSSPLERIKTYTNYLREIKFSDTERLSGKNCKIIEASLDSTGRQRVQANFPSPFKVIEIADLLYQVWIGEGDLLPYKISLSFSMKLDPGIMIERRGNVTIQTGAGEILPPIIRKVTLEIDLFDYDKNLAIEIPEEAKELLGMGTDPAAKEVILEAFKKLDQVKGFRFEAEETKETKTRAGSSGKESTMEGIWQNPDLVHYEESKDEKEIEVYQKGNETVSKDSEDEEWKSLARSTFPSPIERIKVYKDCLANVQFSGEEKLMGKKCKIVEASLSFKGRRKVLRDQALMFGRGLKITDSLYKVWIGENDSLPYRVIFSYSIKSEVEEGPGPGIGIGGIGMGVIQVGGPPGAPPPEDFTTQETILEIDFGYDQDVEIKIPEDLKELLGCLTDLEAQRAVLQAFEKMRQTKGFRFEGRETTETESIENSSSTESIMRGIWQNPDLAYTKISKEGKEVEIYQKGNKTLRKDSTGKKWDSGPWNFQPLSHPVSPITDIKTYNRYLKNVRLSGEEELKCKDYKVVKASLNSAGRQKVRQRCFRDHHDKFTDFLYKVWIGKNDSLPYKVVFSFTITKGPSTTQKVILEINLFNYDKDIEIKIPEEVKELLEKEGGK